MTSLAPFEPTDHSHECRDCGAEIPAGVACSPLPHDVDRCDWPGGNAGCDEC